MSGASPCLSNKVCGARKGADGDGGRFFGFQRVGCFIVRRWRMRRRSESWRRRRLG